jgi:ABC-2 type transport system ATP-binding protein
MLAGLLYPTSGTASVLGYVPWERADGYRRQFALLLGQKNQLWWDLPARDSLELNGRIYGLAPEAFRRTVDEMSELLGVRDKLSTAVRELSLGERMKCELIAALLHQPKVLFLDEPTIGLDVVSQKVVREFLREHNRQVDQLKLAHPDWTGDQLYDQARAIVGAEIARITYNEFLPHLLGDKAIKAYQGYKAGVDARLSEEFAGAAFRFGHSQIGSSMRRIESGSGCPSESGAISLRDAYFTAARILAEGGVDPVVAGSLVGFAQRVQQH